ncbi:DNA alkylation repair protein [Breznakia pachnodae]|uniref:3-methyladenine DNA glycosylase AlkD n=1 Tax=Breznakia pachnodae TaxID=265178 RepID=A0ABU0E3Q6_9FIRM|nr:DNA alkylation repair protein [Breznakia pachnodae]MDQ0361524.1 3-methyladenine DNA glycosylase AlkD [Breznakia pachnodae]
MENIEELADKVKCNILNADEFNFMKINKLFKSQFLKLKDIEKIMLFEKMIDSGNFKLFSFGTLFIKSSNIYILEYFHFFENFLYEYVNEWYECDQYCYRVLNPFVERYPLLYKNILNWTKASCIYVKRAAAVCLIHSSQTFSINVDYEIVDAVCEELLDEEHLHIKKAVGWLLKYSYLSYPEQTISFINNHLLQMNVITFNYAMEKMPIENRNELKRNRFIQNK